MGGASARGSALEIETNGLERRWGNPPAAPAGYDVKFDGFRIQIHIAAAPFGKNGSFLMARFPTIAAAVIALPVRSCIMGGELIAAGAQA